MVGLTGNQIPSLTSHLCSGLGYSNSAIPTSQTGVSVYPECVSWGVCLVSYLLSLTHPHHA